MIHATSHARAFPVTGSYATWCKLLGGSWGCRVFVILHHTTPEGPAPLTLPPSRAPKAGDKVTVHSASGARTVELAAVLDQEAAMLDGLTAIAFDCAIVGSRSAKVRTRPTCSSCGGPLLPGERRHPQCGEVGIP